MSNVNNPTPATATKTGAYSGDGTQNRAIPHGLGTIPSLVIILGVTGADAGRAYHIWDTFAGICYSNPAANGVTVVTGMDATNFYVGDAGFTILGCNAVGYDLKWVAIP
jgi:hypothetical protein